MSSSLGYPVLLILILSNITLAFSQEAETVFVGFPEIKVSEAGLNRVPQNLPRNKAANLRCVISKIGEDYYWASRDNVRMVRIDGGGAFVTFLAINGAGYVRIIKSELKEAASLMSETEQKFDYVEHMVIGLRLISYWGKIEN